MARGQGQIAHLRLRGGGSYNVRPGEIGRRRVAELPHHGWSGGDEQQRDYSNI
jgi:hypothetical protein